jgi:hypothetical protein
MNEIDFFPNNSIYSIITIGICCKAKLILTIGQYNRFMYAYYLSLQYS